MTIPAFILSRFKAAAGDHGWTDDSARIAPHLVEWRERYRGATPLMLMPDTTGAVARIVQTAHETRTPLVPQGGNTGPVGGQIPSPRGNEVLIWMGRMRKLRGLDAANDTLTVEAGCVLAEVQKAAEKADRLFPLSLASEGSAQIGGLVSTNAGGTAVLAYGSMRNLILGLEAVLPNGEIFEGLSGLRKDNTGYDLKQLLCGAEGTLGVVTAATLKLFPRPRAIECALVGVESVNKAVALLALAKSRAASMLTGFELIPHIGLEFVLAHVPRTRAPLSSVSPWYALIEVSLSGAAQDGAAQRLMETAYAQGLIQDGAIAQSEEQRRALWRIRESLPEAQNHEGGSIKHDISVPISAMAAFILEASQAAQAMVPGARPIAFGHVGDGNVHFNLTQPIGADKAQFLARWDEVTSCIHDIAHAMGGSISAEHGLGQMKVHEIMRYKSSAELGAMRAIKAALDPHGIMNPGKVVAAG
jgi:FAD/FMN-containing dehydrogenase